MKSLLKFLGIALLVTLVFSACSKDDDPVDNDFFIGTYDGNIKYLSPDKNVDATGSVTVVKVASGTTYNFRFSDGIPDITGIQFEKKGDNVYVNVGGTEGTNYIRIDADKLTMLFIKDGATWTANCNR